MGTCSVQGPQAPSATERAGGGSALSATSRVSRSPNSIHRGPPTAIAPRTSLVIAGNKQTAYLPGHWRCATLTNTQKQSHQAHVTPRARSHSGASTPRDSPIPHQQPARSPHLMSGDHFSEGMAAHHVSRQLQTQGGERAPTHGSRGGNLDKAVTASTSRSATSHHPSRPVSPPLAIGTLYFLLKLWGSDRVSREYNWQV